MSTGRPRCGVLREFLTRATLWRCRTELVRARGNVAEAADRLGVSRWRLYRALKADEARTLEWIEAHQAPPLSPGGEIGPPDDRRQPIALFIVVRDGVPIIDEIWKP